MKTIKEITAKNQTLQEFQNQCAEYLGKTDFLLVPQWFVSDAVELAKNSGTKIAARVGLPTGKTSVQAKYAEAKMSVRYGASVLCISLNADMVAKKDMIALQNDIDGTKIAVNNEIDVYATIETQWFSMDMIQELVNACKECKLNGIVVSGELDDQAYKAIENAAEGLAVYYIEAI